MKEYASSTVYHYSDMIETCYVRTTFGLACCNCIYKGKKCSNYINKHGVTPGEMKKKEIHEYGNTEQEGK